MRNSGYPRYALEIYSGNKSVDATRQNGKLGVTINNEFIELSEENALAVLVPAVIGHGFLTMEDNTMQFFAIDNSGKNSHSKQLNYTEKKIGLKLPIPVTDISDYDLNAPFLD